MTTGIDSVRSVFAQADEIDRAEGHRAYFRYNQLMHRLSYLYRVPFDVAVACFVATSPNNDYFKNLRSAVSLIAGFAEGKPFDEITVSTYTACAERAWRVLNGENFLDFTKGLKTRSFYRNIVDPFDPEPVTIDGHMIAVWHGKPLTMKEAVRFTGHYNAIADAVRTVAKENHLIPNQVQAVLWFAWKKTHKPIRGDGQLHLLRENDHWGLNLKVEDIQPFVKKEVSEHRRRELAKTSKIVTKTELF